MIYLATCSDRCSDGQNRLRKIESYESISNNKEAIKTYLYETGPVATAMDYSYHGSWDGDIYRCNPDSPVTHAIVITGYNESGGYWIVKNSWGPTWDGDGYFYVGFGECSIENYAYGVDVGTIKTLTISNTGDADLNVISITDNRDWITSIVPTSFIVSPSSSKNVTITVNPAGYSPGSYSGTISIDSNDPDPAEDPKNGTVTMNIYCIDNDGDGYNASDATWCASGSDCNDSNSNMHPGATEICSDGIDNDCDGDIDGADSDCNQDGDSCSYDYQCVSSYCDNDLVGLGDDNWCFTPFNTYFDGQETSYCEYSTNYGIADCDEKQPGEDLDKCVGTSYYKEECGGDCNYQDITSLFECTATDCSCATPQCDGISPQGAINYCDTGGENYFKDDCGTTATAEDTDNICRSANSLQAGDGCTAAASCTGLSPGTDLNTCNQTGQTYYEDECNNSCQYIDISSVFECNETGCSCLEPLCDGLTISSNITTCSAEQTYFTDRCTLTAAGGDRGDNICRNSSFAAGCTADDACNGVEAGAGNCTASCIYSVEPSLNITNMSILYSNETYKIFEFEVTNNGNLYLNNVSWVLDLGDGNVVNGTNATALDVDF